MNLNKNLSGTNQLNIDTIVDSFLTNIISKDKEGSSHYIDTLDNQFVIEDVPLLAYLLILCNLSEKYETFVNKVFSNEFQTKDETNGIVPPTPELLIDESFQREALRKAAFKRSLSGRHYKCAEYLIKAEGSNIWLEPEDIMKMVNSSVQLWLFAIRHQVKTNRIQKSVLKLIMNSRYDKINLRS